MLKRFLVFVLLAVAAPAFPQSSFIPLNHNSEYFLDRIEVKTGRLSNEFHSTVKPYNREAVAKYLKGIKSGDYYKLPYTDRQNIEFIKTDNWEFFKDDSTLRPKKALLKYFFRTKSDFLHVEHEDFDIHASPILHLSYGQNSAYGNLQERTLSNNTRGVEIRGRINDKLGFYTMLTDNITIADNYFIDYYRKNGAFPYESFVKIQNDDTLKYSLNYFQALGYITFRPIKSLQLSFGHDKNFIGNGVRSLILSDFSAPYLQLKMDLRLGRFQYQSIYGQMTNRQIETIPFSQKTNVPKYVAFHHLNFNVTPNLNVGLFESVMFGNRKIGFDLNYLNPIIFYRFIEGYLGSSDNAMVGMDFKWNFLKTASLYGQFILDEYNKKEFSEDLWWSKKYGFQIGGKYFDAFGVNNLDLQFEHNMVRPYVYSHFTTFTNFVNYNLPMAHPLGANFRENIAIIRYQPSQKLQLKVIGSIANKGEDIDSTNYGGDIQKINIINRPRDYGVKVGQGFKNTITFVEASATYMLWLNIYAELNYKYRKDSFYPSQSSYSAGIRWNFPKRSYMF